MFIIMHVVIVTKSLTLSLYIIASNSYFIQQIIQQHTFLNLCEHVVAPWVFLRIW